MTITLSPSKYDPCAHTHTCSIDLATVGNTGGCIWRWDLSVRSLLRGSWPRIRWNVAWCLLEICLRKVRRTQRFSQRSHWWWDMGVRLRPGDEDAVISVAQSVVSPTKEITPLHIQRNMLVAFLTSMVWCTMSSYRMDRILMVISTCKFCRGCAMQFGGNGAAIGKKRGFCITKTHQATHRFLCINSSPIKHSCRQPTTVLSWSRSEWLLDLSYSENAAQGDAVRNHG